MFDDSKRLDALEGQMKAVEKGALATAAELKKALQRISYLEQQVKKLSK